MPTPKVSAALAPVSTSMAVFNRSRNVVIRSSHHTQTPCARETPRKRAGRPECRAGFGPSVRSNRARIVKLTLTYFAEAPHPRRSRRHEKRAVTYRVAIQDPGERPSRDRGERSPDARERDEQHRPV